MSSPEGGAREDGVSGTATVLWGALWADNPFAGKLIILIIIVLLVRAVLVGLRQLARYREERVDLRRVAHTLEEWRQAGAAAEAGDDQEEAEDATDEEASDQSSGDEEAATEAAPAVPAESFAVRHPHLIARDRLLEGIRRTSLVGERIVAIFKMRAYRVKVSLDTLQQLAVRRDESIPGSGFLSFAASLAMLLGILGTFIGLAAMVQQIHLGLPRDAQAIELDLWASSIEHLKSVLGGMKTAFSTSLFGMGTAVVASSLDYRVRRARKELFEVLERLTAEELLPATVPSVEDELLLERVSFQLEESFQRLDEVARLNRETLGDLTATQEAFVEIVDEVRGITRAQAARNLDSLIDQVGRANEAVLRVAEQLPRIASSMDSTGERIERLVREATWQVPIPRSSDGERILGLAPSRWLVVLAAVAIGLFLLQILGAG